MRFQSLQHAAQFPKAAAHQEESSESRSQEAVKSDPISLRRTSLYFCLTASVHKTETKDLPLT